jgi:F0F1-type ATP synthase assembly protein I
LVTTGSPDQTQPDGPKADGDATPKPPPEPTLEEKLDRSLAAAQRDPRLEIPELLTRPVHVPGVTDRPPKDTSPQFAKLEKASVLMNLGIEFVVAIAVSGALGYAVDLLAGSKPAGVVTGLIFGLILAFVRMVRTAMQMQRKEQQKP